MQNRQAPVGSAGAREADAWAVWSEWHGEKALLIRQARQFSDLMGSHSSIEMCVDGSSEAFRSPDHLSSDAPDSYFEDFDWLRLAGYSDGVSAVLEIVRRADTPHRYRGVTLQVWAKTVDAVPTAVDTRDTLVKVVDRGKTLTGLRELGTAGTRRCADASKDLASRRTGSLASIVWCLTISLMVAARFSHTFASILPEWGREAVELLLWCGCHHRILFFGLWIVVFIAALVVVMLAFPAVYVGKRRSIPRRLTPLVAALGGAQLVLTHALNNVYYRVF